MRVGTEVACRSRRAHGGERARARDESAIVLPDGVGRRGSRSDIARRPV